MEMARDHIDDLQKYKRTVEKLLSHAYHLTALFDACMHYKILFAADFSEVFGYCWPLDDAISAASVTYMDPKAAYLQAERARLADAILFGALEDPVIILPPYWEEAKRRVAALMRGDFLVTAMEAEAPGRLRSLVSGLKEDKTFSEVLEKFINGMMGLDEFVLLARMSLKELVAAVQLMSGGHEEGLVRFRRLFDKGRLAVWKGHFDIDLNEAELAAKSVSIAGKIASLRRHRGYATQADYVDAWALHYLSAINEKAATSRRILILISRSAPVLAKAVTSCSVDLPIPEGGQREVSFTWEPDRLLAYEIFKKDSDWENSREMAEEFAGDAKTFLTLFHKLEGAGRSHSGTWSSVDITAMHEAATEIIQRWSSALDEFENVRIATLQGESLESDLEFVSLRARRLREMKLGSLLVEFFKRLSTDLELQARLEEQSVALMCTLDDHLSRLNTLVKVGKSLFEALPELDAKEIGPEFAERCGQVKLTSKAKDVPFSLYFSSSAGKKSALGLHEAWIESHEQVYKYALELLLAEKMESETHLLIAFVYTALGGFDIAKAELGKANLLEPDLPVRAEINFLSALVEMLSGSPPWEDALTSLDCALSDYPEDPRYLVLKGVLLWRRARYIRDWSLLTEAIEATRAALRLVGGNASWQAACHDNLAYYYLQLAEEAEEAEDKERLAAAETELELLEKALPPDQWVGDYYHTQGTFLLLVASRQESRELRAHYLDEARVAVSLARKLGVSHWRSRVLDTDLMRLGRLERALGTGAEGEAD
jgi:tetratricopeptide (TPR) repeat protein